MTYEEIARAQAGWYMSHPQPMRGINAYTSPEQIEAARMNAAYYWGHPGGMRGQFEDRPGALEDNIIGQALGDLGADIMDKKTLTYAGIGALAAYFLMGKKPMNAGIGAIAGYAVSKMM